MKIRLTCREAARLLLERREHDLPVADRLALQVHVTICQACQRFAAQLDFMQRATRAWRGQRGSDDEPPPGS